MVSGYLTVFELAHQMLAYLEDCSSSMTASSHDCMMIDINKMSTYILTHIVSEQIILFGFFNRDPPSRKSTTSVGPIAGYGDRPRLNTSQHVTPNDHCISETKIITTTEITLI